MSGVMPRIKTSYPGVYYREAERIGGRGKEKIYYIVFKKDGKTVEEKVGRHHVDNMTPARAAGIRAERIEGKRQSRKELRELAEKEKQEQAERWTITRLWEAYKVNRAVKGIVQDENRYKLYIAPTFADKEPSDIVPLDVDRLRIKLSKTKSQNTVHHVLELLRRIINFGVRSNLCRGLSFRMKMPSLTFKTEDLTADQLKNLVNVLDQEKDIDVSNLMRLALLTGMRRGELFRLKWSDVNFQRGTVTIRNPKGGVDQTIPVSADAIGVLQGHPRTTSEYVFPGRGGSERTSIAKKVRKIAKEAGLPKDFRPIHGLRHVFASMLASSGQVDLYTIQKLLTHKSPVMTQRYAHLRDEAMRGAANIAGEIVRNSNTIDKAAKNSL